MPAAVPAPAPAPAPAPEPADDDPIVHLGAPVYVTYAFWHGDLVPSWAVVDQFRSAHARAATAAGIGPAEVAAQAELFRAGAVWRLPARAPAPSSPAVEPVAAAASRMTMSPAVPWLSNAVRFAVTPLRAAAAAAAVAVVAALVAHVGSPAARDEANLAGVLAPLLLAAGGDGEEPSRAALGDAAELLTFALNTPQRSDAHVYSVPDDDVVVVRAGLSLDVAVLEQARRMVPLRPSRERSCVSRLLCVWCGASPIARGVRLAPCPGCRCVAYCSAACAAADATAAHDRECRAPPDQALAGGASDVAELAPRYCVAITRAAAEAEKPRALVVELPGGGPLAVSLNVLRSGDGGVIPVPMAWTVRSRG